MTTYFENERRQFDRLYFQGQIHIFIGNQKPLVAYTMNLSDGGLLIEHDTHLIPTIDQIFEIQAQDFPNAPIKKVIVRRISEDHQIGVEFV